MKKYIFIIIILLFSGCSNKSNVNSQSLSNFFVKPFLTGTQKQIEKPKNEEKQNNPQFINLNMGFVSQAPFADWDDLHNDACEEASILNVYYYLKGEKSIDKTDADNKILQMVNWQKENFGGHYDLSVQKTKELIQGFFGYKNIQLSYDINIEDIKKQLAIGNPVILPASGRDLGNPNFRSPGPVYHMLVVRGYDEGKYEFITNDVGTRKGENYRYNYNKLYQAIHDLPTEFSTKSGLEADPNSIKNGRTAMIIIEK